MKEVFNRVFDKIKNSEILDINGYLIQNWRLNESEEPILEIEYKDEDEQFFNFYFTKKSFENASIDKQVISLKDELNEDVQIACYSLHALI